MAKVNYNGQLLPEGEMENLLQNRSFSYGDGLFETLRVYQGKVLYWSDHWERLSQGLYILDLHTDFPDETQIHQYILDLVAQNNFAGEARVKLQVWRKSGGLVTPEHHTADWALSCKAFTPAPSVKTRAGIARSVQLNHSAYSSLKSANFLPYILAGLEKKKMGWDEILLTDDQGHIAEASMANVFWIKKNILFTPSLQSGCIAGVMRRQILRKAQENGVDIREGLFLAKELIEAELAFTSNISGLSVLENLEGRIFQLSHPLYEIFN